MNAPGYRDLYVTAADIPRTRLFNLPYELQVQCTRVSGWQLWHRHPSLARWECLAGEYDGAENWLLLDVDGHVILDSRVRAEEP